MSVNMLETVSVIDEFSIKVWVVVVLSTAGEAEAEVVKVMVVVIPEGTSGLLGSWNQLQFR